MWCEVVWCGAVRLDVTIISHVAAIDMYVLWSHESSAATCIRYVRGCMMMCVVSVGYQT